MADQHRMLTVARTDRGSFQQLGRIWISHSAARAALATITAIASFCYPSVSQVSYAQENRSSGQQETTTQNAASTGTETDPNAVSLTIREAVKLALKQNPRLLAARLEALESLQTANVSRSEFLPKATLVLEDQMNRLNLATLIGQQHYPYSVGPFSNLQLGSNFDVPIIAVSAWRSYQAEKQRTNASELQASDLQEAIASLVVGQYLSSKC